jgi:hypothetical protein
MMKHSSSSSSSNQSGLNSNLVTACGGDQYIQALPILDLTNRMGGTDYIDFITPQDMSASVMRGIDCFRRPLLL